MKNISLITLFILGSSIISSAQIVDVPENNKPPHEYAEYMADLYTRYLGLSPEQHQQTYITILEKRKVLDSLRANNIHVDNDKLWAISASLDTKYKEILSSRQYLVYEDMQAMRIVTLSVSNKRDSSLSH